MQLLRTAPLLGIALLLLQLLCGCGGLGNNFTSSTAAAAAPTPTAPTPSATPPNATVFNNIQQQSGWQTCGDCGNTGAQGATATYQMNLDIASPSESGDSAQFSIGGTYAYSNAYWYYRHPAPTAAMSSLTYEFDVYIPSGSDNAPQAIEFECQQELGGYVYNFAWQADYVTDQWRVFNYTSKQWEDSGIALTRFTPDSWHHIIAQYHNDATTHTTYHDALTVDGTRYPVNISHPATPTSNTGGDFTNAFQLDLNGIPTAYSVYVDKMEVTEVN